MCIALRKKNEVKDCSSCYIDLIDWIKDICVPEFEKDHPVPRVFR